MADVIPVLYEFFTGCTNSQCMQLLVFHYSEVLVHGSHGSIQDYRLNLQFTI
jgi:hypothetical protein